jgi:hypothetical protein
MTKTFAYVTAQALALTAFAAVALPLAVQASAEPLPYGPDTCINGFVWREARPGDTVCVTPATRSQVAQQNGNAGANRDPSAGSGPMSCSQGYVWREAFDGDTICVTPDIRSQTLADNAAAPQRKAANQPQAPAAQNSSVQLGLTGGGTAGTIDISDPANEPRQYDVPLPFTRTLNQTPKSGDLYQIVGVGKDGANPGCQIKVNGTVVTSEAPGGSGQCVWVAP